MTASLGALQTSSCAQNRLLDATVRVGDPKLDNYHSVQGDRPVFTSATSLPIEDGAAAIAQRIWLETDRVYRAAAERLIKIRTSSQVRLEREDSSADFTEERPASYSEPAKHLSVSLKDWEARARKWSAAFNGQAGVLTSSVSVSARRETKYLVSTEGTRIAHGRTFARITLAAQTRAADGMNLAVGETFDADEPSRLPDDKTVLDAYALWAIDADTKLRLSLSNLLAPDTWSTTRVQSQGLEQANRTTTRSWLNAQVRLEMKL